MEFSTPTLASCSREHQQIYQDWFAYADSGFDFIWLSFLFTMFFSLRSYLSLQMGTGGSPDRMLSTSSPCPIYHGPNLNRFFFLPFPFPLPFCHVASSILIVMPMLIFKQKTKKQKKKNHKVITSYLVQCCYVIYLPTSLTFLFVFKVWGIADSKRQGYLGFNEFVTAMQVPSPLLSISYTMLLLFLAFYIYVFFFLNLSFCHVRVLNLLIF